MNNVIKQQNLNVFWSEPSLVVSKFNKKLQQMSQN